jgi:hypothetical protein
MVFTVIKGPCQDSISSSKTTTAHRDRKVVGFFEAFVSRLTVSYSLIKTPCALILNRYIENG